MPFTLKRHPGTAGALVLDWALFAAVALGGDALDLLANLLGGMTTCEKAHTARLFG